MPSNRLTWRAAITFFLHELRRHRKPVLIGWLLLIVPPLVHRVVEGHWRFFAGDWPDLAALYACWLLAPTLAAMMAISGWAREREERSLEWLYARSWGSGQVFLLRLMAVCFATMLWIVGCLALYRPSFADLSRSFADRDFHPGGIITTGLALLAVGMGSGFLAAALSATRSQALGRWFLGSLLIQGVSYLIPVMAPLPTQGVLYMAWPTLGKASQEAFLWVIGLGALAIAGWLMQRAPGEIHWRRGIAGLTFVLLAATAASVLILLQPMRVEPGAVVAVRDLGQGAHLEMVQAKYLPDGIYHPVVRGPSGSRVLRRVFVRGEQFFAHPESGQAVMRSAEGPWNGANSEWVIIRRDGGFYELHLNQGAHQDPLGWSTDGRQFAWRTLSGYRFGLGTYRVGNLLILGEDRRLRMLAVRDLPRDDRNPWTAAWIGAEQLLVTTEPMLYAHATHARPKKNLNHWWMAITSDGERVTGPHDLPDQGQRLFSPAMSFTPDINVFPTEKAEAVLRPGGRFSPTPVSRVGETTYFLLAGSGEARVVGLDPTAWELQHEAAVDWDPGPFAMWASEKRFVTSGYVSLGALDEGPLVWTARTMPEETVVFARIPSEPETRRVCYFEHARDGLGGFRGATQGWAIWADAQEATLYACHVASGTTRHLTDLGPFGARSVDVTAGGVLGLNGWIELESPNQNV